MPSRSTKISILLAVDVVFFFVELIVGYAVGSLALVADSFHMLNDVMSLIVALYAIKLTKSKASPKYSYGWHRAEIVAALINGVFLLALCFSILMEAIERFFNPPQISNAKLVVVVGSLGLASNFLGLLLFREHSHSHSHGHSDLPVKSKTDSKAPASSSVLPTNFESPSPPADRDDFATLYGHPAATRASVVQAAQDIGYGRPVSPTAPRRAIGINHDAQAEREGHQRSGDVAVDIDIESASPVQQAEVHQHEQGHEHEGEQGTLQKKKGGHGGAHGSMNMHALILHVIGDALGNVGVISSGLVIWLSTWRYKDYFDPFISLIITVIIFSSALPLVRSASFILLQAVPPTISIQDLREDIQKADGVLSVHELHVWQLSENKIVASVHVWVSRKREYMRIAQDIRRVLHDHGVHSSTIQPEFYDAVNAPEERLITTEETHCLLTCPPDQDCPPESTCCPPQKPLIDI